AAAMACAGCAITVGASSVFEGRGGCPAPSTVRASRRTAPELPRSRSVNGGSAASRCELVDPFDGSDGPAPAAGPAAGDRSIGSGVGACIPLVLGTSDCRTAKPGLPYL